MKILLWIMLCLSLVITLPAEAATVTLTFDSTTGRIINKNVLTFPYDIFFEDAYPTNMYVIGVFTATNAALYGTNTFDVIDAQEIVSGSLANTFAYWNSVGVLSSSNALTADQINTSALLAGILTDETGNAGGFVRATSPTLVTPALGTIASGNGAALTALTAANITVGGTYPASNGGSITNIPYDAPTNTWTVNTSFPLGQTNQVASIGAVTAGVTGISYLPTSVARWGQLDVIATGNITFTNPASIRSSDFLTTRTITNGNTATISFSVIPGRSTNMAIVQFR